MLINKIPNPQAPGASSLAPGGAKAPAGGAAKAKQAGGADFASVLKSTVEDVRFSAHAKSRLVSRNISMTPEVMEKLSKAVSGAGSKGANNSLVLLSDLAFIVNIPSRTVITAMDGESIRDNVFTNIDSTVIAS
jgi:flagellar operon protein